MSWIKKPRLVKVEWDDATNLANWQDRDEIEDHYRTKPYRCENIGYLVFKDKECLMVAARISSFNSKEVAYGLTERLPRGMITRITYLKEKK